MTNETTIADARFAPNAQAFLTCMACDTPYPHGQERCSACNAQLSLVRRCPHCQRILAARHEQCIYCAGSLLAKHNEPEKPEDIVAVRRSPTGSSQRQLRAALFGVSVFVVVFLAGLLLVYVRQRREQPDSVARTYAFESVALRTEAKRSAATGATVPAGTVLPITGAVADEEGRQWFEVSHDSMRLFVPVTDVAPPSAETEVEGDRMLRTWLVGMKGSSHVAEAVQAVNQYCGRFAQSVRCEELRWAAAERIRALAAASGEPALQERARGLYASIAQGQGPHSQAAAETLRDLPHFKREREGAAGVQGAVRIRGARQYSLIDRAEVHVHLEAIRDAQAGTTLQAPVAREVVINGQIAVPRQSICSLAVVSVDGQKGTAELRLVSIRIDGRDYRVSARPQIVSSGGALVVFQLDAPLLIGN